ncbi:unnamed protein product [Diatraea saccharalis]|uniref:C2H2-type domain-containing protein n=1 Tax=Diatraea saccharalis TaxID=40085 RepID=A0A9N9WDP2_9NEOP|nr:unnamed protein product [Diatraea saccharalis]
MATVKEEPMDDDPPPETAEASVQSSSASVTAGIERSNRIILGSKPCPKRKKIKPLYVSLENWGDRLDRSPCYCKECMILFATRNALDAHKMSAHSFLVAVEAPKDDTPQEDSPQPNHKFCNHCNTYFEDDNMLIQHLYDLIQAKQAKVKEKPPQINSKPNPNNDNVNIPIQNSNCLYLTCKICSCYFKTVKEYNRHCSLLHKAYGVAHRVMSSPDTPVKCKYCDRTSKNPALHNTHVRVIHYSIYSKPGVDVQKTKKLIVTKAKNVYARNNVYKCSDCNLAFNNIHSAKVHQRNVHENHAKLMLTKSNPVPLKSSKCNRIVSSDTCPVPKKVLFKCDKCSTHFLSCIKALVHSSHADHSGRSRADSWTCTDCNRVFRKDKQLHQLQHKYTNDFKVYELHANIYSRVLYRCVDCDIYFEERVFPKHAQFGCHLTTNVEYCSICKINVNNGIIHKQKHASRKIMKSDLIIIDDFVHQSQTNQSVDRKIPQSYFVKTEPKPDLKRRNVEFPEPIPKKKMAGSPTPSKGVVDTNAVTSVQRYKTKRDELYYCSVCKSFVRNLRKREYHISNNCEPTKGDFLVLCYCLTCGLKFSCTSQLRLHKQEHMKNNVFYKNYKFICIRTLKPCNPPLPDFNKCKNCKVNYINNHTSCTNVASKTCNLCNKTFTAVAHRLHMLHHKIMDPKSNIESTLEMKYRMLKPTWNILYNCKVCDVTTDSYDNVIDHCQKHYNKMESYNVTIHNCDVCVLNFEEKCYKRHMELHENQTIDRDSFTILSYDYFTMLTNDWLKIFDPLPKEQMRQILSHSIYSTRIVKMTVLQNGPPEYTMYQCLRCTKFVENEDVSYHTALNKCKESPHGQRCILCRFIFASNKAKINHMLVHKKQHVMASSFRIVAFNHPCDAHYNSVLKSNSKIKKTTKPTTGTVKSLAVTSSLNPRFRKPRYVYYQCQKCYCCISNSRYLKHVCISEDSTRLCRECNFVFSNSGYQMHYHRRHVLMKMTSDDVLVRPFNNDIKPGEWRVSLTDCSKCCTKFPSHLIKNHKCIKKLEKNKYQIKNPDPIPTMTLYRCPGCKIVFSDKLILTKHEKSCILYNTKAKTNRVDKKKELIYKCSRCDVYMLNGQIVKYHQMLNHKDSDVVQRCKFCKWRFSVKYLNRHISVHHKNSKLTPKDFNVVEIDERKPPTKTYNDRNERQMRRNQMENVKEVEESEAEYSNENSNIDNKDHNISRGLEKTEVNRSLLRSIESKYRHYENTLFRCPKCDIHYLHIRSLTNHIQCKHRVVFALENCPTCGLKFGTKSLKKHILSHERDTVLDIVTPKELQTIEHESKLDEIATTSKINESVVSQSVDEEETTEPEDEETLAPENETVPDPHGTQTLRNDPSPSKTYTHKIYKCKECNVYFVAQNTCYIHMLRHTPIDPKEYIECKLCNLPFKITALSVHIKKHHNKDFNLDEVLVEEYSKENERGPKIEIYYAIDRVQSRLVSTTCDEPGSTTAMDKDNPASKTCDDSVDTSVEGCDVTVDVHPTSMGDEGLDSENVQEKAAKESNQSKSGDEIHDSNTPKELNENFDRSANEEACERKTIDESIHTNEGESLDSVNNQEGNRKHKCRFCDEIFNSNTSKEFHESLDHLDVEKACEICKLSFNTSILNELHLNIRNDTFQCCLCRETLDVRDMTDHAKIHSV